MFFIYILFYKYVMYNIMHKFLVCVFILYMPIYFLELEKFDLTIIFVITKILSIYL